LFENKTLDKIEISSIEVMDKATIELAFKLMCTAKTLAEKYEQNIQKLIEFYISKEKTYNIYA
jgi:hypothetical protein